MNLALHWVGTRSTRVPNFLLERWERGGRRPQFSIPKGLYPLAQGCEARATLVLHGPPPIRSAWGEEEIGKPRLALGRDAFHPSPKLLAGKMRTQWKASLVLNPEGIVSSSPGLRGTS